jgi:peptidoglycan/LPS O-acetylase OafA/YrhL
MSRLSSSLWIHTRSGAVAFIICGCAASFSIAFVSWYVIEERFLRLKKYFSARPKDQAFGC